MFGNKLCDTMPKTIERKMDNINVLNAHLKLFVFMLYYIKFETILALYKSFSIKSVSSLMIILSSCIKSSIGTKIFSPVARIVISAS